MIGATNAHTNKTGPDRSCHFSAHAGTRYELTATGRLLHGIRENHHKHTLGLAVPQGLRYGSVLFCSVLFCSVRFSAVRCGAVSRILTDCSWAPTPKREADVVAGPPRTEGTTRKAAAPPGLRTAGSGPTNGTQEGRQAGWWSNKYRLLHILCLDAFFISYYTQNLRF